jgi:hypothetical protein
MAAAEAKDKADRVNPGPATAWPRWVRNVNDYERRETSFVEGRRFG